MRYFTSIKPIGKFICFGFLLVGIMLSFADGSKQAVVTDADHLKVLKKEKGIFVSTANSVPYSVISQKPDLASMVGKILDRNYIMASTTVTASEDEPSLTMVEGTSVQVFYRVLNGRFACLEGNVLTLTSYQIRLSTAKDFFEGVLAINSESQSIRVNDSFIAKFKNPGTHN